MNAMTISAFSWKFLWQIGLLGWLFCVSSVSAQDHIEVIALRYRPVEQVVPILQPILRSDEAISGQGFNLIVRARPATLAQIRDLLQQIDRPQRQLLIQVRFGDLSEAQRNAAEATGQIEVGREVQVRGRARFEDTQALRQQNQTQQIRVLEGGQAWIQSGSAIPYRTIQVVTLPGRVNLVAGQQFFNVGSGFNVRPQLRGDKVWLEINPQQASIESVQDGRIQGRINGRSVINQQQAATAIEIRLGEWVELAGNQNNLQREQSGILSNNRHTQQQEQSIWLKVELIEH